MSCRLATPADLEDCLAFEWTRGRDDLAWHVAGGLLFLAERDGAVVGYARIESFWKAMPYLALITVAPAVRGTGIGSELLAFVCTQLRERGHTYLLSSTTGGETGPERWHARNGFAQVGTLAGLNDDGVDERFWRRPLNGEVRPRGIPG